MRRSPSPFPPRECEIEAAAAAAMAINLTKDVALGPLPPPTERGTDPPSPLGPSVAHTTHIHGKATLLIRLVAPHPSSRREEREGGPLPRPLSRSPSPYSSLTRPFSSPLRPPPFFGSSIVQQRRRRRTMMKMAPRPLARRRRRRRRLEEE